ncbi:S1C family serine protease [Thiomonas sp. FB-Cd]|uniref:S1C family serine protease n=1 Tax=Thiomonas sp. FB-Cd TaxID=1158292 RepID=UPI0004DF128B|nr:trypsin-like peptidase domain-containing protein [Thiomonas sp. FB-Cd]
MRRLWLIFAQATTLALGVVFAVQMLAPQWLEHTAAPGAGHSSLHGPSGLPTAVGSYAAAASRAMPAVVSVTTTRLSSPREGSPLEQFFGGSSARRPTVGLGSGVIVSPNGYVLTNNHVVDGAEEIEVKLADGREAAATVVGRDPDTDLAVLKINLRHLPTLAFADDTQARVGDVVLAIGYPFGVGQTVTQGIISALGRTQLGINTFEDFIQTDAAINPGNSGGALVDVHGNLLGINTAIFSRSGGSLGIGFAVPATITRNVMQQLIAHGRVVRGWIGVEPQDITPQLAQALNLPVTEGVIAADVLQGGPADHAGMRAGNVVLDIGGQPVHNTGQLLNAVAALKPGSTAAMHILARGHEKVLQVRIGTRPRLADASRGDGGTDP